MQILNCSSEFADAKDCPSPRSCSQIEQAAVYPSKQRVNAGHSEMMHCPSMPIPNTDALAKVPTLVKRLNNVVWQRAFLQVDQILLDMVD